MQLCTCEGPLICIDQPCTVWHAAHVQHAGSPYRMSPSLKTFAPPVKMPEIGRLNSSMLGLPPSQDFRQHVLHSKTH